MNLAISLLRLLRLDSLALLLIFDILLTLTGDTNMTKKIVIHARPIQSLYFYDGRSTLSSRKADFKGSSLTPHGAKRAAYKHLDKDYGDAKKVIITDLRTGLELWHMSLIASTGTISIQEISAKTQTAVAADIKSMKALNKKF
jgi:hypothetical protein